MDKKLFHKNFEDYLTRSEQKYTSQRRKVVEEVTTTSDHFEVESFIDRLHARGSDISRGTVYTTIKLLLDSRMIRKIRTSDNKVYYEMTFGAEHHDHLICNTCGKVIEVHDDVIEDRQDQICKKFGFKMSNHIHNIYGTCKECLSKG
jgi:Fur family transcriptional regulator, ferric uptake regulator